MKNSYPSVIISLILILLTMINCKNKSQKKLDEPITKNEITNVSDTDLKSFVDEVYRVHKELTEFKDEREFHKVGFEKGNKYSEWLSSAAALKDNPASKILIRNGVLINQLPAIGFEYLRSKGKNSENALSFRRSLESYMNSKSKSKSDKTNTDLKESFGEWEIKNSVVNMFYNYKIYKLNEKYIGIKNNDGSQIETLIRKGNKFIIEDNDFGEYYIINSNKQMILYDKDGDLRKSGYTAKLIK